MNKIATVHCARTHRHTHTNTHTRPEMSFPSVRYANTLLLTRGGVQRQRARQSRVDTRGAPSRLDGHNKCSRPLPTLSRHARLPPRAQHRLVYPGPCASLATMREHKEPARQPSKNLSPACQLLASFASLCPRRAHMPYGHVPICPMATPSTSLGLACVRSKPPMRQEASVCA